MCPAVSVCPSIIFIKFIFTKVGQELTLQHKLCTYVRIVKKQIAIVQQSLY